MDIDANFLLGFEHNSGFNLILNSQLGMENSNTNSKLANKNTGFSLTLGYRF